MVRIHVWRLGYLLAASLVLMLARVALNPALLKVEPAEVNHISIATFKDWVKSEQTLTLIDARDWVFYRDGHIAGAKNLPRRGLQADQVLGKILPLAKQSQKVVLYCSSRECTDSGWLATELLHLGYRQVWVLEGGWEDWLAQGGEVSK